MFAGISLEKKAGSIYQALCLPVSVSELLQANQLGTVSIFIIIFFIVVISIGSILIKNYYYYQLYQKYTVTAFVVLAWFFNFYL
jgi:hypothetical protein